MRFCDITGSWSRLYIKMQMFTTPLSVTDWATDVTLLYIADQSYETELTKWCELKHQGDGIDIQGHVTLFLLLVFFLYINAQICI